MILFKKVTDIIDFIAAQRALGKTIGFVPTMGALHQGHITLVEMCKSQNDLCICSIFINPTQFNDQQDFEKYPVTISNDILKLSNANCDVLFMPSVNEIYPSDFKKVTYALGRLENILEGEYRPGHFQGVCQVVHRLLNIVTPDKIYLGQKDYQQVLVIKKLMEELDNRALVIVVETRRETSGLAMSSRNTRLNESVKNNAAAIFTALTYIEKNIGNTPIGELKKSAESILLKSGFDKIDYVEIAEEKSLEAISEWDQKTAVVVLVAAFIDGVRLIDNIIIKPST